MKESQQNFDFGEFSRRQTYNTAMGSITTHSEESLISNEDKIEESETIMINYQT